MEHKREAKKGHTSKWTIDFNKDNLEIQWDFGSPTISAKVPIDKEKNSNLTLISHFTQNQIKMFLKLTCKSYNFNASETKKE